VDVVGDTTILAVVAPPGAHTYDTPPAADAESVVLCPEQIVFVPLTITVGVGFTVTL